MEKGSPSRTEELTERLADLRRRAESLPGAPLALEVARKERERGGGLLAGGVAFRFFLWLVPFGLVVASALSLWSALDEGGLESAAREFGVGAAAAQAAAEALHTSEQNAVLVLAFGLVVLAWFSLGAVRALLLSYALAWGLDAPKIRRPFQTIVVLNGLYVLAFLASGGLAWLREQIGLGALVGIAVTLALTTAVSLLGMWLLPHCAASPRELLPGALLVGVGQQLVQVAVVFYFAPKLGESEETYGAFGAAATMLVWLYVLARLVTGAAFLNATLWAHRRAKTAPS